MTRRVKAVPAHDRAARAALLPLLAVAWLAPVDAQLPPAPPPPTLSISPAAAVSAANAAPAPSIECGACGKVESIRQTTVKDQWTPLGTGVGISGAPVSPGESPAGVASYKIGPGMSNQGMVVLGAAGGAAYSKTPNSYERPRWELTIKLDTGSTRVVHLSYEPYVHEGDRVRIAGNNVELLED
jgi:outer membrane lipoprotein SlyB